LFLATFIDEERFQHPAIHAQAIPISNIVHLVRCAPHTTLVLNNLFPEEVETILKEPGLALDHVTMDVTAMDKPFDGLLRIVRDLGSRHLLYGSQMPFLYPEAALALVRANGLAEDDVRAILEGNWRNYPSLTHQIET
jgi:hypothetical protein